MYILFVELCDPQMSSQLLNTLKSMREDESLCDVWLCVGSSSTKFPAHKIVLAAASPYFRYKFLAGFISLQIARNPLPRYSIFVRISNGRLGQIIRSMKLKMLIIFVLMTQENV